MHDLLLTLTVPAVVVASGVYTACDCRRGRRNPLPYTRAAARRSAREAVRQAEDAVSKAYAAVGCLYAAPGLRRPPEGPATVSGRAAAGPDHGPSLPAPARRP
ncbi:hypothetical protein [Streptomyces sp. bgisy091]|uniref:hypothetical protein n=1 Tax=Streptomyces sp. bgisy091 TaxID=3413778 RepID=UPI003D711D3D